jgi:hypothetical protein
MDYDVYIASVEWKAKSDAAKERAGGKCQLCGCRKKLETHHNTYERLGNELPEDLVVLCGTCHDVFHAKRDKRTARKYKNEKWVQKWKKKDYSALPPIPTDTAEIPKQRTRRRPAKGNRTNGNVISVVVTPEYMEKLISCAGGISYAGLRLIGEVPPYKQGWKTRAIGRELLVDEGELLAEQASVLLRREPRKTTDGTRAALSDEDIRRIRQSANTTSYNKLAKRWKCTREEISKIMKGFR